MKNNKYLLSTLLAAAVGLILAAVIVIRTFWPNVIFPAENIPNIALLSLAVLLADHYLAGGAPRCYVCVAVFSLLAFGMLPFVAGYCAFSQACLLGLLGCTVFTVTTWLFSELMERLSSGPVAKAAPVISAFLLYLAAQCFTAL